MQTLGLVEGKRKVTCAPTTHPPTHPRGKTGFYESIRFVFFCLEKKEEKGSLGLRWRLPAKEVGGEVSVQVDGPSTARAGGTPKRFWLWSKYGPSGPPSRPRASKPQAFPHFTFIFLVAKCLWLSEQVGRFPPPPLIFTHKMCISRTKGSVMGPLVLANFLSVLSRNSFTAFICFTPVKTKPL